MSSTFYEVVVFPFVGYLLTGISSWTLPIIVLTFESLVCETA
jgi:hypothetical protein